MHHHSDITTYNPLVYLLLGSILLRESIFVVIQVDILPQHSLRLIFLLLLWHYVGHTLIFLTDYHDFFHRVIMLIISDLQVVPAPPL